MKSNFAIRLVSCQDSFAKFSQLMDNMRAIFSLVVDSPGSLNPIIPVFLQFYCRSSQLARNTLDLIYQLEVLLFYV